MWFKNGLKAQKLLAQGNTLGTLAICNAPCKGKSFISYFYSWQAFINTSGLVYTSSRSLHSSITADSLLTIKSYNSWSISA